MKNIPLFESVDDDTTIRSWAKKKLKRLNRHDDQNDAINQMEADMTAMSKFIDKEQMKPNAPFGHAQSWLCIDVYDVGTAKEKLKKFGRGWKYNKDTDTMYIWYLYPKEWDKDGTKNPMNIEFSPHEENGSYNTYLNYKK